MNERTDKPWWAFFLTVPGIAIAGVLAGGIIVTVALRPQAIATMLGNGMGDVHTHEAEQAMIEQAAQTGAQNVVNQIQPQLDQIKGAQQTQQHQLDILLETALASRQLARGGR